MVPAVGLWTGTEQAYVCGFVAPADARIGQVCWPLLGISMRLRVRALYNFCKIGDSLWSDLQTWPRFRR
ncbi:hypothetical protein SBBP2_140040 [Burkholderiales bacterium]|nr:hypothetical protein SBBP2_140040 [Burkholderiales bacterium]